MKIALTSEELLEHSSGMHAVMNRFLGEVPIKEDLNEARKVGDPAELGPKLKKLIDDAKLIIKDIFSEFDKDGCGSVDTNELSQVVK